MTIHYCGCHGITFSYDEDGGCPSCEEEWVEIDETSPHHPDYVEPDEDLQPV